MRKTRKLCAVMLDTTGREIMVMREHEIDEKGWPEHVNQMEVKEGQKVHILKSHVVYISRLCCAHFCCCLYACSTQSIYTDNVQHAQSIHC